MKKKPLPRLTLKRETIRQLEQPSLRWVAGASIDRSCGPNSGACPAPTAAPCLSKYN